GADGAGEDLAFAVDDGQGALERVIADDQALEGAQPHLLLDGECGHDGDAEADLDHFLEDLDVVALHLDVDADPVAAQDGVDLAPGRQALLESDEIAVMEIL